MNKRTAEAVVNNARNLSHGWLRNKNTGNNQKRLKAKHNNSHLGRDEPRHHLSKTGSICFTVGQNARLVGCVFDLLPGCTRF